VAIDRTCLLIDTVPTGIVRKLDIIFRLAKEATAYWTSDAVSPHTFELLVLANGN
jgi:hypothetical protein